MGSANSGLATFRLEHFMILLLKCVRMQTSQNTFLVETSGFVGEHEQKKPVSCSMTSQQVRQFSSKYVPKPSSTMALSTDSAILFSENVIQVHINFLKG